MCTNNNMLIFISLICSINMILIGAMAFILNMQAMIRHEESKKDLINHIKWLYDSLKVINPRVKTPYLKIEEPKKGQVEDMRARVISPRANGMDEFNGQRDDFHG